MPEIAAAASWMETFKMPLRDVEAKYTRSEMAILAWRSGEIASNMMTNYQPRAGNAATPSLEGAKWELNGQSDPDMEALEARLGPVAGKLTEDMDMRKLTGDEMLHYLSTLGIYVGFGNMGKAPAKTGSMEAQVSAAYRNWGKK